MCSKKNPINVKVFNMIINKSEAKTMAKCNCKWKPKSTTSKSNKRWNNRTCQCEHKNYCKGNKYSWNTSTCSCENSKYLKSNADTSAIACDDNYL